MIIILHRPQMAENVGFVARSMKNFGLSDLRLVSPGLMEDDEWDAKTHNQSFNLNSFLEKAEGVAKGGSEIIKSVKIFDSIEEACFDVSRVYALSARRRDIAKEVITPENAVKEVLSQSESCAFLFGRESSGLSNANLSCAYKLVEIEAESSYPSINLGMSACIMCYLLYKEANGEKFKNAQKKIKNIASTGEVSHLMSFLEEKLEKASYFKVKEKREGMMINIKNIFARNSLTKAEVKTLIGIFSLLKNNS